MVPPAGAPAVRCPGCGAAVAVPTTAPAPVRSAARPAPPPPRPAPPPLRSRRDDYDRDDDYEDDRPARKSRPASRPPRKRAKSDNSTVVLATVGGVGALFVIGLGLALVAMTATREKSGETAEAAPAAATQSQTAREPKAVPRPVKTMSVPAIEPTVPPPAPAASGNSQDTIQKVKESTVYIRSHFGGGRMGLGSGFFAGKPGHIVTNAHVVGYGPDGIRKPTRIEIVVASGEANQKSLTGTMLGVDAEADLAVLKVDGSAWPAPLPFGTAAALKETDEVLIFGFPLGEKLGLNVSVNKSTVSSLRKEKGKLSVVQVAGGMAPGNSGGPVTNQSGHVIGVSVAGIVGTQINFAIPAEIADEFVRDQIASGGKVALGKLKPADERPRPGPPRFGPPGSPGRPGGGDEPSAVLVGKSTVGGANDPMFHESAPDGGVLVGLEVGLTKVAGRDAVRAVRPIFRVGDKETRGEQRGTTPSKPIKLVAKPGYAVGGMNVRFGANADGLSLIYMKLDSDGDLDPTTAYESDWVGSKGGQASKFGGNGIAVIGLAGRATSKAVTGLGLVLKVEIP